jgi:hypothetical protein
MAWKCPSPSEGDNGTITDCIQKGHCGCVYSTMREMKGIIRSIRLGDLDSDDPFFIYQQGDMSKGKLIEIICERLLERFDIDIKRRPGS